jgi:predicted alpha/beta-fold hydrolase
MLVVAIHGLGGDINSHYIRRLSMVAHRSGAACLRLNLRGADMSGDDFYHAGLTADLHAALSSTELSRFRRIVLVGYSIGGHIVLRYATETLDPRVSAVAAICPPLDLAQSARDIDDRRRWPYRRHVLVSLRQMLTAIDRRRRLPLPLPDVLRIRNIRRWDEAIVAPRFGFRGANDYYEKMSMAGRFDRLRVPALIIASEHDPMVLRRSIQQALPAEHPLLDVRWLTRAGHVGFPADVDFEGEVLSWLTTR